MNEEINFDDVEFGEPIEEKEPSYRDGYIRGIYRAKNIIDSKQKEIERLNKTNNEIFKANETLVEEIERLNNILDRLGLLDKDIDKETKIVNMTITLPKWLKDIGKKNKINFSKLLQESLYEVLQIGSDKE